MKRKAIKTRRLELRPLVGADHATWFEAYAEGGGKRSKYDLEAYAPGRCSRAVFLRLLARHSRLARADDVYAFGVFHRRSRVLVGTVDIGILHRRHLQVANLGYRIFHGYWRMGYGREAVRAAIHAAFEDLRLNRLEVVIDPDNRPSQGLARALGLRREGLRRKCYFQFGRFEDQVVFSAQREDYGHAPLQPSVRR
jgi:RimJ/RimL family protein N-acetyltransferase